MRSPLGCVNRIAKRLGRIWYSLPRVVSGAPIIGLETIWTKSADSVATVRYVSLAWSRMGQGSEAWSVLSTPIKKNAECGMRSAELIGRESCTDAGVGIRTMSDPLRIPHSTFRIFLLCPHRRRLRDAPPDDLGDDADLPHQLAELLREERLRPVRQRLVGVGVDFHHDAVRARRHRRPRHRDHLVAQAGAVRR